ncbi:metallophosphoesterase family protein [Clostridium thermarum]|uniref:metallophosphoesterase family protein n=1 Tax=Clostridium thermarum TaxID=1716543 RepID=UPI0013CF92FB|nr:metallophosphoesterase family protein [Clostridium thermarum]
MKFKRVAVVSDIHANIHALKVFMDYLNARPEIEIVLNLGDFLQLGPNPTEVFDIVVEDKRFVNILGNNEIELIEEAGKDESLERIKHMEWTKNAIGEHRLKKLRDVPKSKAIDLYGKKFMMVHTVTEQYIDLKELEECEYVLMGHTHQQVFGSYWKERRIMNPGSIGHTPNGLVNFAVIEICGEMINFVFKNISYNKELLHNDLLKFNVPGAQRIIKHLITPGEL